MNVQEELSKEMDEIAQPFTLPEGNDTKGTSGGALTIEAYAVANQRTNKKMEKNIENIKKKVLPEALKSLESSFDKKMKKEIAASSAKIEKKMVSISSK